MSTVDAVSRRAARADYYARNKEKCKQASRTWYANNKQRAADQRRDYVARNKEKIREWKTLGKYGITSDNYNAMLCAQLGVCAICKGHEPDQRRAYLAVDHCHETGKVRGLLCSRCNTAIGLLGDDVEIISAAAAYLTHARISN